MIDFRQRTPRAARPNRAAAPARQTLSGGAALCVACNDNGTVELHPAEVGEHSARGVRADLAAGHLKLCDCEAGTFWREMLR